MKSQLVDRLKECSTYEGMAGAGMESVRTRCSEAAAVIEALREHNQRMSDFIHMLAGGSFYASDGTRQACSDFLLKEGDI